MFIKYLIMRHVAIQKSPIFIWKLKLQFLVAKAIQCCKWFRLSHYFYPLEPPWEPIYGNEVSFFFSCRLPPLEWSLPCQNFLSQIPHTPKGKIQAIPQNINNIKLIHITQSALYSTNHQYNNNQMKMKGNLKSQKNG